ncbi:metallophosphoesterase [Patescibacteria group bacterium]|nr:metallophosphoesterase [Patescibacteria group bacterium]MBU1448451.1 metallophosphoesterase [Patescibacteria group bacterium]MBU2612887.1 metallophosphoesterase [Patescibacteria group bacterium]
MTDWRKGRSLGLVYDVLTAVLAGFGVVGAAMSFRAGGLWMSVGMLFALGVGLIVWGVFIEPQRLIVRRYREPLMLEPKTWVRLVFVSDMHAGPFRNRRWFERVSLEVASLGADLVVFGGDFVSDHAEAVEQVVSLGRVHGRLGTFFVLGNHDYQDDPVSIRTTVAGWGIADLTNGHISVQKDGRTLQISGMDDCWYGTPASPPTRVSATLPHISIAHEPDIALDVKEGDTDLIITGHTHGGQIRLPFLGALAGIPSLLGRRVDRGRKVVNGVPLIVSEGLGEADVRARLFCPPEVTVVDIGI